MAVEEKETGYRMWLKRVGIIGFLFFLFKGLLWVGVAAVAYYLFD